MREPDVPSVLVPEPILMLLAPIVLSEVPSTEDGAAREDRVAATPSMALSTEAWTEAEVVVELDQSTAAPDVPPVGLSQVQSSSSFFAFSSAGLPTEDQRKAPVTSTDDGSSSGHTIHFNIRLSDDESALANLELAKRLIQAVRLSTDWENRKSCIIIEMFLSFYPMILGVSFSSYFFFELIRFIFCF